MTRLNTTARADTSEGGRTQAANAKVGRWILVVSGISFGLLLGLTKITNYDIWWSLATGRQLLTKGFPVVDPFSYTRPAAPPHLQGWLADCFFYLTHSAGGLLGLGILKVLLAGALLTLIALSSWRRYRDHPLSPIVVALLVGLGGYALKFRLLLRHYFLALFLLVLAVDILRRQRWEPRSLFPKLGALQLLWCNLHGSFPLGVALPVLFLVGDAIENLFSRSPRQSIRRRDWGTALLLPPFLAAISAVNPDGPGIWFRIFRQMGPDSYRSTVGEWAKVSVATLLNTWSSYTWGFTLLIAFGALGAILAIARKRRPGGAELVLFLFFGWLPFQFGIRFVAEFVVVAVPIVAGWWLLALPRNLGDRSSKWLPGLEAATGVVLLLSWWLIIARNPIYEIGLGEKSGKFPRGAVEFIQRNHPDGRIFNSMGFGGYIMWNLPDYPVFIDGRELVYTPELHDTHRRAHHDPAVWSELQARYEPTIVMLEYLTDYSGKERMSHLDTDPDWALVYWDRVAVVYVRRTESHRQLIQGTEYRWARPHRFATDRYIEALRQRDSARAAVEECERLLESDSTNAEAYLGLAILQLLGPEPDRESGLFAVSRAIELTPNPDAAIALDHWAKGRLADSLTAVEKAKHARPFDPLAYLIEALVDQRKMGGGS